jgi:hypothetical protein
MIISVYATILSFWDVQIIFLIPKRILRTYIGQSSEFANLLTLQGVLSMWPSKRNCAKKSQNMLVWLCKMVSAQHLFTGC